jgi:hypothetical protein
MKAIVFLLFIGCFSCEIFSQDSRRFIMFHGNSSVFSKGEPYFVLHNTGIRSDFVSGIQLYDSIQLVFSGNRNVEIRGGNLIVNRMWILNTKGLNLQNNRLWVKNELNWGGGNVTHSGNAEFRWGTKVHNSFQVQVASDVWTSAWLSRWNSFESDSMYFPLGDGVAAPVRVWPIDTGFNPGWVSMQYVRDTESINLPQLITALDSGRFAFPLYTAGFWQFRFRRTDVPVHGGKFGLSFTGEFSVEPGACDSHLLIESQMDTDGLASHVNVERVSALGFNAYAYDIEEDADFLPGLALRDVALSLEYGMPQIECRQEGMWLHWQLSDWNDYRVEFSRNGAVWDFANSEFRSAGAERFLLRDFRGGFIRLYSRSNYSEAEWRFAGQYKVECNLNEMEEDWQIMRDEQGWILKGHFRAGDEIRLIDSGGRLLKKEICEAITADLRISFSGPRGVYFISIQSGQSFRRLKTFW